MKVTINDREKQQLFVAIFELLKGTTSILNLHFKADHLYIQGMDRSHVCLFDISIQQDWFTSYEVNDNDAKRICIHTQTVYSILSSANNDSHTFLVYYDGEPDSLFLDLITNEEENKNKKTTHREFSRFYKIPLMDDDYNYLEIPESEYDADFTLSAKKINEIVSKMSLFGESLLMQCNEERIDLSTEGLSGHMKVTIPLEDITECSITENIEMKNTFHLGFLQKICLTTKLSEEIQFSMTQGQPLKIQYPLGKDSHVTFFLAPKADD